MPAVSDNEEREKEMIKFRDQSLICLASSGLSVSVSLISESCKLYLPFFQTNFLPRWAVIQSKEIPYCNEVPILSLM